jgi:hypothetical protein
MYALEPFERGSRLALVRKSFCDLKRGTVCVLADKLVQRGVS